MRALPVVFIALLPALAAPAASAAGCPGLVLEVSLPKEAYGPAERVVASIRATFTDGLSGSHLVVRSERWWTIRVEGVFEPGIRHDGPDPRRETTLDAQGRGTMALAGSILEEPASVSGPGLHRAKFEVYGKHPACANVTLGGTTTVFWVVDPAA